MLAAAASRRRRDGFEPAPEACRVRVADAGSGGIVRATCGGDGERLERGERASIGLARSSTGSKAGRGHGLEAGGRGRSNGIKELGGGPWWAIKRVRSKLESWS